MIYEYKHIDDSLPAVLGTPVLGDDVHKYSCIKMQGQKLFNVWSGDYEAIDKVVVLVVLYKRNGEVHSWKMYEGLVRHDEPIERKIEIIKAYGSKLLVNEACEITKYNKVQFSGFYD